MTRGTHARRPDPVPSPEPGLTLVEGGPAALHRIVVSALAGDRREALWVDPGMAVSVYDLYDLAPSRRALAGLRVARAFTAYQHHALVRALVERATPRTGLVVLPGVADLYRDEDVPDYEREPLFEAALAMAAGLADSLSVPVVCSDDRDDALSALAADHADETVAAERTREGLAFRGAGFETLGYWRRDYWQTTIPYWVDLLGAVDPEAPPLAAPGTEPLSGPIDGPASPSLEG